MISATEIRECAFCQGFAEPELAALASIGLHTRWKAGEVILEAGSNALDFYIIQAGTVLLSFPNGRALILREGGQTIGWSSFVSPFKNTATALCLTDAILLRFPAQELSRLIQMDAGFGQTLTSRMAVIMEERRPYREEGSES